MDEKKLETFLHTAVNDMAATFSAVMLHVGHRLGFYRAMRGAGPMTSTGLAQKTGTHERYVREWLDNQAAGGYVVYDRDRGTYELPEEQAAVLADPDSPFFMAAGMDVLYSMWSDEEKMLDAIQKGKGVAWHEHHPSLFSGTEAFFRPGYRSNLATSWIPALEGVQEKLQKGAKVADLGCGHGASTIIMAEAFPESTIHGFDYHDRSIETAKARAKDAGVQDRVRFEVASAKTFPGSDYDLICFMDCLHDMGDPLGAAKHCREVIAEDGAVMLVEPFAGDRPEDNHNPVGRLYYAASTVICTANSLAQEVGTALGAQAGEARLSQIFNEAGFRRFRRATETPFNLVLEARP